MSFIKNLFKSPKPPVILSPPAPPPPPPPGKEVKTEVEQVIDTSAKEAAEVEVKKAKKRRGYSKTILTSGLGIEEGAPTLKKKLGA